MLLRFDEIPDASVSADIGGVTMRTKVNKST